MSIVLTQVMTSSICPEETGEDAGSPGEGEPSEGGEGELKLGMGEGEKRIGDWNSYICT